MKKKLLMIILSVVLLGIIAGLTVYAINDGEWFIPEENLPESSNDDLPEPPNDDIPQFKEFTNLNGEVFKLSFDAETTDERGLPLYTYTDDQGNYYYYNKEGALVRSWLAVEDDASLDEMEDGYKGIKVSEEEAREIAEKYLLENQGESFFDKYTFVDVKPIDSMCKYHVHHYMLYGKGSFIKGQYSSVSVRYDGVVYMHDMTNPEKFEGFNFEVLDSIAKEDVIKFVEEVLEDVASKGYDKYEILDYTLNKDDDGYYIGVFAMVDTTWIRESEYIKSSQNYPLSENPHEFEVTFRYPLENK